MSEQPPATRSADTNRSAYDVADIVPVDGFDAVSAGTNVLVSGPPQSGKTRLALRLLARGTATGEQAIAVTADVDGTRLRQRFEAVDGDPSRLHVVDCSGASGKESFDDAEGVRYVSSPADLTGIGLGVVKCTRQIVADADADDDGVRLSTLSLSTMLRYTEMNRLFGFLHVLTGRVSAAGYLGVSTVDPTAHSDEERNTLRSLYDVVVELRETDDGSREIRVVGDEDVPSTWRTLAPP
ncbi:RecA-superfamily ATPase, KaiC/GvpD/RAD55 family [Halogranum gelatinilyticum]|uniref:RecA-superfamily ATPase, KaiC/GvpD/RAD55 family n=1 Tax=Halogranum gelatinilyticum TaxID=660521 RepID=A0A1G9Q5Y8_9EURY|nr:ATPase domain-containing protein [Halogranum gelatinilyticum]SDM06428.1 RecA-superfamily ATPase, KaiC/GvpD/RAD55 family [Halogranum gelatinilyticum]